VINEVKGTWYGNLPCADCTSISYQITLHEDMSFASSSLYNGKSEEEISQKGKWEVINDSTIEVGEGEGKQQIFNVSAEKLTMLDQQGKPIASDFSSQYELNRKPVATNNAARMQADMEKLQDGIDFKAQGNEPFWSVEIDFDKAIHFKSLNHPEELSTPVPKPAQMQDAQGERYRAVTEAGELIVTILKDSCSDSMSGAQFPYKVRVDAKLATDTEYAHYEGCGRYLTDYRLHNIWVVEEMQGESLKAEDFAKGLPTLEFMPEEGQVGGHDGCNRIFGKIETQGKQLKFGVIGATRMACPNMEKSDQFTQLINEQTLTYAFEPRQLLLKQGQEVVLRLKNVD
jgi:heat shock protein HslJ/uncharacterized membrane protein